MEWRDGRFRFSPSDLTELLGCRHSAAQSRAAARGERDKAYAASAYANLVFAKGNEHEDDYRRRLIDEGRVVEDLRDWPRATAAARTIELMRAGADVIFQGRLEDGDWRGVADFLERVDEPSDAGRLVVRGGRHEARARRGQAVARAPALLLQRGRRADPGPCAALRAHRARLRACARRCACASSCPTSGARAWPWSTTPRPTRRPSRTPSRRASSAATGGVRGDVATTTDHLTLVAGIRRTEFEHLRAAAVSSRRALGAFRRPTRGRGSARSRPSTPCASRPRLQVEAEGLPVPPYELLPVEAGRGFARLPEPSAGDVFFDIEGDPFFDGRARAEFLFGLVLARRRHVALRADLGARPRGGGRGARARRRPLPRAARRAPGHARLPLRPYETAALKRLMARARRRARRSSTSCCGSGVLVDLYDVAAPGAARRRRATRSRRSSGCLRRARPRSGAATTRSSPTSAGCDDARPGAARRHRALQRGGLPLDARSCATGCVARCGPPEVASPGADAEVREPSEEDGRRRAARRGVRCGAPGGARADSARWLAGELLEYHRREARPAGGGSSARCEMTPRSSSRTPSRSGCSSPTGRPPEPAAKSRHPSGFRFPAQQHKLDARRRGLRPDPESAARASTSSTSTTTPRPSTRAAERSRTSDDCRAGADPGRRRATTSEQQGAAARSAGRSARATAATRTSRSSCAATPRSPPLARRARSSEDLDAMRAARRRLEGSYLFVQGPPGTGKTWTGARLIIDLIARASASAIASQSHKAIHKLLSEVEADADETGVTLRGLKKARTRTPRPRRHGGRSRTPSRPK